MDISQLSDANFSDDTEPMDKHLMDLLTRAYKGEITCRMAIARFDTVTPYSTFTPEISDRYRFTFVTEANEGTPPLLYVYAQGSKLIMSDDYAAYYMYKEYKLPNAVCVVIGDTPEIDGVMYKGDPFILPPPTIDEVEET